MLQLATVVLHGILVANTFCAGTRYDGTPYSQFLPLEAQSIAAFEGGAFDQTKFVSSQSLYIKLGQKQVCGSVSSNW